MVKHKWAQARLYVIHSTIMKAKHKVTIYIHYLTNQVLGKNTLAGMMKTICRQIGLERELNNHSIPATSITVLNVNKFSNRNIMSVSGHSSETSLKTYTSRVSVQRKNEMSLALTEAVIPKVTI
jgi:DMSO reductase anchor subunit